jgi:hypothetical protein
LPLADRKKRLSRLIGRRRIGIVLSEHTDEDGAAILLEKDRLPTERRYLVLWGLPAAIAKKVF